MTRDPVPAASQDRQPAARAAAREWDGVGQALRAIYGNYRGPPPEIASALARLDAVD